MAREIRSASDTPTAKLTLQPDDGVNSFKDRLVKLIPSEIITAYVTIQGLISGYVGAGNKETLMWVVFGALFVLTPIYLYFITDVRKWGQIIFTSIAFVIWVIAVGSPITTILDFPSVFIGSVLLVIYTLLIPFFYKG
jgi:hypothetical protein